MGRKATPTAIKKLRGGDKRYINDAEPKFSAPTNIRAPAVLGKHGRQHWKDLAPLLVEHDLLTTADLALFTQLCIAYELSIEARLTIKEEGLFRKDEEGVQRKHPGVQVWRDAMMAYAKLANEFGLSPAARAGLGIAPSDDVDPYKEFLRSKDKHG